MFRNVRKGIEEKTEAIIVTTNMFMVWPHLHSCVQFWSSHLKKHVLKVEKAQRMVIKMIQSYRTASL